MSSTPVVALDCLNTALRHVVRGFGSCEAEVEAAASNLIKANLTGHDSHGIGMLPRNAQSCLEGGLKPSTQVSTVLDAGAQAFGRRCAGRQHAMERDSGRDRHAGRRRGAGAARAASGRAGAGESHAALLPGAAARG